MEKCTHEQSCCGDYVIDFIWTPSFSSREPSFNPSPTRKPSLARQRYLEVGSLWVVWRASSVVISLINHIYTLPPHPHTHTNNSSVGGFRECAHEPVELQGWENCGPHPTGLIPPISKQNDLGNWPAGWRQRVSLCPWAGPRLPASQFPSLPNSWNPISHSHSALWKPKETFSTWALLPASWVAKDRRHFS